MQKKILSNKWLLIMLFSIVGMIILITPLAFDSTNIAEASGPNRVIEQQKLYYNTYCDLDNGFIPKTYDIVKDSKDVIINDSAALNMDILACSEGTQRAYSYAKPTCFTVYDNRQYTTNKVSDYSEKIFMWSTDYYKFRFYTSRNDLVDDSYNGNIYGVDGLNNSSRLGKGAVFFRQIKNGKPDTWMKYVNMFGDSNEFYLPVEVREICDYQIVNVYERLINGKYYNLRQEFYCKFRVNKLFVTDIKNGSELSNGGSTSQGFKIEPSTYFDIDISRNGVTLSKPIYGNYNSWTFTENGLYQIRYKSDISDDYTNISIIVDKTKPFVVIGSDICDESYSNYDGIYRCFNYNNAIITWSNGDSNTVTTSVSCKKNGTTINLINGGVLDAGDYDLTITKSYTTSTISVPYKIRIKIYDADHNYKLLCDNASYAIRTNRFSTKCYGVRINENGTYKNYCFETKKDALEKGLDYEMKTFVTKNSNGSFTYRNKNYVNNALLTSAMSTYVEANYYFENRDLTSKEIFLMDEKKFKTKDLYLNGFKFQYDTNPVYSKEVRVMKSDNTYTDINDEVRSILRDRVNGKVITLKYNKFVDEQLLQDGKYFILETNAFGSEYFWEAYFVKNNTTSASVRYLDNNGIYRSDTMNIDSDAQINCESFTINNIKNTYDLFATIIITNSTNTYKKILTVEQSITLNIKGTYTLKFIDRNGNSFQKKVVIATSPILLSGVNNGGTANSSVTITILEAVNIEVFYVNGVEIPISAFTRDSSTGRYCYTIQQKSVEQDVVLLANHNGQSYEIGFNINAKV